MIATESPSTARQRDVARILDRIGPHASRRKRATLAVLVGLPASGKSRIAEALRSRTGAVALESDELRRLLFPRRTYSPLESQRLFAAIHAAIEQLLAERVSVILDATNLAEAERAPLCEIAERQGARLVLAEVTAPERVVRRRLARRGATGASRSEADLRVYERMRSRVEEIQRPHYVVDTSQEIASVLADIAKEMIGA